MIRTLFWLIFYICTLGLLSIKITYKDGLAVSLKGWPDALMEWRKSKGEPQ